MTFLQWKNYFEANQAHFSWMDWNNTERFTPQEIEDITRTIQTFQKGENSEGKNLIHYAKAFGNPAYLEAIKHFIREEQRHALVLGRLMTQNNIPKLKDHWTDSIFRKLRNLSGLETSVLVLLTAEIIAAIFYKALHNATGNRTLQAICNRILIDEEMHINFQCYTLSQFHEDKPNWKKRLTRFGHRFLMEGTCVVVYFDHRTVLNKGSFTFSQWRTEVMQEFNRAERMVLNKEEIQLELTLPIGAA